MRCKQPKMSEFIQKYYFGFILLQPTTRGHLRRWLQMQRDVIERSAFFCFPAVKTVFLLLLTEKPIAVVRWENITTLTCTSFGYPAPQIIWYQCSGIRPT